MARSAPPNLPGRLGVLESRAWGAALIALYAVLAGSPLLLAALTAEDSGDPLLSELGAGVALAGFAILTLQVALSARLPFVDRPFGLDVVTRFHRRMAVVALLLFVSHPLLLAAGRHSLRLFGMSVGWPVTLGKVALVVLALGVGFALAAAALRIRYEVWRFTHKGIIVVVVLGFIHSTRIGGELESPLMLAWWWVLLAGAVGLFLYRNVFVPRWGRRRFRVVAVRQETHNTYTVALEPQDGRPLRHRPGQFMFLKLVRPGRTSEEHPFTISSSPTGEWPLTATIKESGDYTNTIGQTRVGDTALVEGPFGRFSYEHHEAESLVFIAGGVGITPLMSMLRGLRDLRDGRRVVLVYANRSERDIIFREELAAMPANVKVVHVLSEAGTEWHGLRGLVTREAIEASAGDLLERAHVFICGPPQMMKMVVASLREMGVPRRRIHFERFSL